MRRSALLFLRSLSLVHAQTSLFPFNSYTALGDSYSAGIGAGQPVGCQASPSCNNEPGDTCLRSSGSYGYLLNQRYKPASFVYNACSGANTTSTTSTQIMSPSSGFGSPDLVTFTIGGNDNGAFLSVVLNCVYLRDNPLLRTTSCANTLANAKAYVEGQAFRRDLGNTIRAAQTTNLLPNQNRTVLVLGYAQFYNIATPRTACEPFVDYPSPGPGGIRDQINKGVLELNSIIKATATGLGAKYADVDPLFQGHRFCEGNGQEPWFFNGPLSGGPGELVDDLVKLFGIPGGAPPEAEVLSLIGETFHPTSPAQRAYLSVVKNALGLPV